MKIKRLYILPVVTLLALSCYEDKGNYDYNDDVNSLIVTIDRVYGSRKVASTFVIEPEVEQTHYKGTDNLRHSWWISHQELSKGEEVGTTPRLEIEIDPADPDFKYNYYIQYYITDTITGATRMFPTQLRIAMPYQGAWMVLHQQEDSPRLGSVEYVGDQTAIDNDAFYSETGNRLSGTGYSLGVMNGYNSNNRFGNNSVCMFYMFTSNPAESGFYAQDKGFQRLGNTTMMFPEDLPYFDASKVTACCRPQVSGGVIASNGEVFQGSVNAATMGRTELSPAAALDHTDYHITHATTASQVYLAFDGLHNRFFSVYTRENTWRGVWTGAPDRRQMGKFEYIAKHPTNVQSINPDNIGDDKQMVYLGPGYFTGRAVEIAPWQCFAMYAFAVGRTIPRSYVFEFSSRAMLTPGGADEPAPFSNYFVIDTPPGVTGSTPMASSWAFNRILFYAIGNRIYKLDFAASGGVSTMIYQHPNPEAKIVSFKMARSIDDPYNTFNEMLPAARTLGAGFNLPDGSGELVVLILNTAGIAEEGMFGDFPTIQRYSTSTNGQKFGEIKDIAYI